MFGLMGNCMTWAKGKKESRKSITLLAVGLDNAGKTTTVHGVKGEPNDDVAPTVGFSSVDLYSGKYDVKIYDLGGGVRIRDIWHNYMAEAHAVIFVIDSADVERMDECRRTFEKVVSDRRISGKPVLILANKQDKPNALDETDLCDRLNLEEVVNRNECLSRVEHCSALPGKGRRRRRRLDRGIKTGFAWLLDVVGNEYDELQERIAKDVEEQTEREAEERRKKLERVQRIREERERRENAAAGENRPQPDGSSFQGEVHDLSRGAPTPARADDQLQAGDSGQNQGDEDTSNRGGLGTDLLDDDDEEESEPPNGQGMPSEGIVTIKTPLPGTVASSTVFSEEIVEEDNYAEPEMSASIHEDNSDPVGSRSLSKASLREIIQDTPSPSTPQRTPHVERPAPTPLSISSIVDNELGNDSENTNMTEDSIQKKRRKKRKKKKRKPNKVDPLQPEEGLENVQQPRPLPGRLTPLETVPPISGSIRDDAFGTLPS